MSDQQTNHSVRILGYCELDESEIMKRLRAQGPDSLRDLRGEYTLVIEGPDEVYIITSPFGALHYFYTVKNGALYHSDKLVEIIAQSGLSWEWDWRGLGDVCQLENLTDNISLHRQIKKVPSGSVLHFKEGTISLESRLWVDSIESGKPDPEAALDVLNDEAAYWAGENPYLSLSGGFDSRVILSSLLKQGIKPHLITMGTDTASDVIVARQISSKFGLNLDLINIELEDLLTHASDISALTNGTKTARHWHTYIYPNKAGIGKDNTFYVGTLGEFARSYFFDNGFLGQIGDMLPRPALLNFWKLKLRRNWTFTDEELQGLAPEFREQLDENGRIERSRRLANLCHNQFLPGLARYYLEQRVPNFYANGVKMYLASTRWVSPFHSRQWINHIWRLGDKWKLGSNWHRYAIRNNFPELLEFQEEKGSVRGRMLPRAPLLYWTPFKQKVRYQSYDLSQGWYRSDRIAELLMDNLDEIDDLIDRKTAKAILDSHIGGANRTRSLAFLLTMILWKLEVKKAISISK